MGGGRRAACILDISAAEPLAWRGIFNYGRGGGKEHYGSREGGGGLTGSMLMMGTWECMPASLRLEGEHINIYKLTLMNIYGGRGGRRRRVWSACLEGSLH